MTLYLYFALLNKGISGNTAEHNLVTVFFEKLIYYEKRKTMPGQINGLF